jgi:cobalt-zinc-cadmium efflux system outer membrane protein
MVQVFRRRHIQRVTRGRCIAILAVGFFLQHAMADVPAPAASSPGSGQSTSQWTIAGLQQQALQTNPSLTAFRYRVDTARAQRLAARAYPNPSVGFLSGGTRARAGNAPSDNVREITFNQPLEWPAARGARIAAADARLDATRLEGLALANDVLSDVRFQGLGWLVRREEILAQEEALRLLDQTRRRVAVRVDTGEAPRYELIKADAEVLAARARLESARAQAEAGRFRLAQSLGVALPADFELQAPTNARPDLGRIEALIDGIETNNPELLQQTLAVEAARLGLDEQVALRRPAVQFQGKSEQDATTRLNQLGLQVSIPLFDRRRGFVQEAQAELGRAQNRLDSRRFELSQRAMAAYQALLAAQRQVDAIEGGLLKQAEAALRVAESAYRFGERGILDTLDAQRVLRGVRSDLLQARLNALAAVVEIDRLAGSYLSTMSVDVPQDTSPESP